MLNLKDNFMGQTVFHTVTNDDWVIVGHGIGNDATSAFVVGSQYDAVKDETIFKTMLLKNIVFKGHFK